MVKEEIIVIDISIFSSGGHFVQQSRKVWAIMYIAVKLH